MNEILPNWINNFLDFNSNIPINRIAYTEEDIKYKCMLMKKMQELGMDITFDSIGNICGSLKGQESSNTVLALCSHTDSVPNGGQYDGCIGIVVSLVVIEKLVKQNRVPKGNIKVIICACEEASRFSTASLGSKYLCGELGEDKFLSLIDKDEITLKEAIVTSYNYMNRYINEYGIRDISKTDFVIDNGECENAIELHIEQYDSLAKCGNQIGIVNSIASIYRLAITIKGQEGHSGSTPMEDRKDAVLAGSLFVTGINEVALKPNSNFRVTVPRFETETYSMNKIS